MLSVPLHCAIFASDDTWINIYVVLIYSLTQYTVHITTVKYSTFYVPFNDRCKTNFI